MENPSRADEEFERAKVNLTAIPWLSHSQEIWKIAIKMNTLLDFYPNFEFRYPLIDLLMNYFFSGHDWELMLQCTRYCEVPERKGGWLLCLEGNFGIDFDVFEDVSH